MNANNLLIVDNPGWETDLPAFQRYIDTPWEHDKGYMVIPHSAPRDNQPRNFIIMNYAEIDASSSKDSALSAWRSHMADYIERTAFGKLLETKHPKIEEARNELRSFMGKFDDSKVDFKKISMVEEGGGAAELGLNLAHMDSRATSLASRLGALFQYEDNPALSPEKEFHMSEFTRHHEAAHLMLGLKEPGSDYAAAVLTLRQNPQAREYLQMESDLRLAEGIAGGYENYSGYGAECSMAIQEVLQLPPEEILTMSSAELHKRAVVFDQLAANNELNADNEGIPSPEDKVYGKVIQWGADDYMLYAKTAVEGFGLEGVKLTLKNVWDSATKFDAPDLSPIKAYLQEVRGFIDMQNIHPAEMQEKARDLSNDQDLDTRRLARNLDGAVTRLSGYVYGQ